MPHMEKAFRRQWAMLWPAGGFDNYGQHRRAAYGIEIKVRWTNKKTEALDPQGNKIALDATVVVARDIPIGSIMWEGSQQDLDDSVAGTGTVGYPESDLFEVVTIAKAPDIKARAVRRTLGLKRYNGTMPGVTGG